MVTTTTLSVLVISNVSTVDVTDGIGILGLVHDIALIAIFRSIVSNDVIGLSTIGLTFGYD